MGISTKALFKKKKWTLAIQCLSVGEHTIRISLDEYDPLRVIVNRENTTQDEYLYQLKKDGKKYTILKKVRD